MVTEKNAQKTTIEAKSTTKKKVTAKEDVAKVAQKPDAKVSNSSNVIEKVNVAVGEKAVKTKNNSKKTIRIKQIASGAGRLKKQIATLKGLGLNKINRVKELEDTLAIRGMINKVKHLVIVIG